MPVGYSLQVAQTAQSGATGSTALPYVNNAELIFGSEGIDLSGGIQGGDAAANPQQSTGTDLTPGIGAASASGQSSINWLVLAGVGIALILLMKHHP